MKIGKRLTVPLAGAALAVVGLLGLAPVSAASASAQAPPAAVSTIANQFTGPQAGTGTHPVVPDSGWLGTCYPSHTSTSQSGWCDGNGPDWHYFAWVDCTNGGEYYGVDRWAGDRRGSTAYCPGGTSRTIGGLAAYHV